MSNNMRFWNQVNQPPKWALKAIQAGRLKGKTDISPQWRYEAMTNLLGPCGIGWKYEVSRVWSESGSEEQIFAFAEVKVFIKDGEKWSDPVPGIGGSMLVEKEKAGLHASDEGYKMAITDALSVALKMFGVGADIYAGLFDGSKYLRQPPEPQGQPKKTLADYTDEVDKLPDAATVLKWMGDNRPAVLRDLNKEDAVKLKSYCGQIVDVFNSQPAGE